MIKHIVMFRFKDSVPDDEQKKLIAELSAFPAHYASMQRWAIGTNISRRDSTFTHAFTIEFDTEAELLAYLNSTRHERFVETRFRPLIEKRAIASYVF